MAWKGLAHYFRGSSDDVDNEKMASKNSCESWINRREEAFFKTNCSYCGVVESIQSKRAATIVIAQKKNGIPLLWHEDWDVKNANLGRVLLIVDRLRASCNGPEFRKETIMYEKLQEGETVMVEIKNALQSPDNIYKYFAKSAYKTNNGLSKKMEISFAAMRDPLRGVVDSLVSDAAVIRFGTYDGRNAKAVATIESVHYKGEKIKKHLPIGSVMSVGTQVYVEITKWSNTEVKQEWEKLLYKEGVIFRTSLVWLKDDPRPLRSGGKERQQKPKGNIHDKTSTNVAAGNDYGRQPFPRPEYLGTGNLTNIHAYYGIVESITSGISAVACTAHRNSEPLTWHDNWFAKGAYLERIFVMADHIRPSKNDPEYLRGTRMKQILKCGDLLRIVVDPAEKRPDKCYKWFAKTCWKVDEEESELCTIPVNSLPGHLCGIVESVVSHYRGIIIFKTYHGVPAKAFFTHDSYYQNGRKLMKHLPLGSEVIKGTEVHLVVDKWHPGNSPNEEDQEMIQNQVLFKATLVWSRGSTKPNELESKDAKKDLVALEQTYQKHGFQKKGPFEKLQQVNYGGPPESDVKNEKSFREGKHFARGRGGRHGMRGRGRGGHYRRQRNAEGGKDDSDCHSNCTEESESNLSDLSSMSDFFGAVNYDEDSSESFILSKERGGSKQFQDWQFDNDHKRHRKQEKFASSKAASNSNPDISKLSLFCPVNPLDKSVTGTIISVDENWGLVQVGENHVHDFQSNAVLLYGLKLDNVPLHKLFHQGQHVKVCLKGEKVSILEYGAPQLPDQMRQAVSTYCEMNSVPHSVRATLEKTMQRYGV